MFENVISFFKKIGKKDKKQTQESSKDAAKERLHLVLMQDRANVSADFLELMKQEIIEVIKKYIEVDEKEIDVRLTNNENEDGTNGAPSLYANIPILNMKNETRKVSKKEVETKQEDIQKTEKSKNIETEKENKENKPNKEIRENKENKENRERPDKKEKEIKKEEKKETKNKEEKDKQEEQKTEKLEDQKEEVKSENKKEKEMI